MVKEIVVNDVYYLLKEERMMGLTVKEAAEELGVSTRTIFRMIEDGRLKAEKVDMPYGKEKYIWIVNPMSVARMQVRKEMELEQKAKKSGSSLDNRTPEKGWGKVELHKRRRAPWGRDSQK